MSPLPLCRRWKSINNNISNNNISSSITSFSFLNVSFLFLSFLVAARLAKDQADRGAFVEKKSSENSLLSLVPRPLICPPFLLSSSLSSLEAVFLPRTAAEASEGRCHAQLKLLSLVPCRRRRRLRRHRRRCRCRCSDAARPRRTRTRPLLPPASILRPKTCRDWNSSLENIPPPPPPAARELKMGRLFHFLHHLELVSCIAMFLFVPFTIFIKVVNY